MENKTKKQITIKKNKNKKQIKNKIKPFGGFPEQINFSN